MCGFKGMPEIGMLPGESIRASTDLLAKEIKHNEHTNVSKHMHNEPLDSIPSCFFDALMQVTSLTLWGRESRHRTLAS